MHEDGVYIGRSHLGKLGKFMLTATEEERELYENLYEYGCWANTPTVTRRSQQKINSQINIVSKNEKKTNSIASCNNSVFNTIKTNFPTPSQRVSVRGEKLAE